MVTMMPMKVFLFLVMLLDDYHEYKHTQYHQQYIFLIISKNSIWSWNSTKSRFVLCLKINFVSFLYTHSYKGWCWFSWCAQIESSIFSKFNYFVETILSVWNNSVGSLFYNWSITICWFSNLRVKCGIYQPISFITILAASTRLSRK